MGENLGPLPYYRLFTQSVAAADHAVETPFEVFFAFVAFRV